MYEFFLFTLIVLFGVFACLVLCGEVFGFGRKGKYINPPPKPNKKGNK